MLTLRPVSYLLCHAISLFLDSINICQIYPDNIRLHTLPVSSAMRLLRLRSLSFLLRSLRIRST